MIDASPPAGATVTRIPATKMPLYTEPCTLLLTVLSVTLEAPLVFAEITAPVTLPPTTTVSPPSPALIVVTTSCGVDST